MQDSLRCSECGEGIPPNAPQGLCPKCLMKQALESDSEPPFEGSLFDSPDSSGNALVDVISGRDRLRRRRETESTGPLSRYVSSCTMIDAFRRRPATAWHSS